MSQCPEFVAQLQKVKSLSAKLNREIEEFSASKDDLQVTRKEKLLKVLAVYQTRKDIANSYFFKEKMVAKLIGQLGNEYNYDAILTVISHITEKAENNQPLTKDEIGFIYQLNIPSYYFMYGQDDDWKERKAILKARDPKEDLAFYFGCQPNEISKTQAEAVAGGIKYHYGNLYLQQLDSAIGLMLPKVVLGLLDLSGLHSTDELELPAEVGNDLSLNGLQSAKNLVCPVRVGRDLMLYYLTDFEILKMPKKVGGSIKLQSLESGDGLTLPEEVGGDIYLSSLKSAKGLKFPKKVWGRIILKRLQTIEDLILPEEVGGEIEVSWKLKDELAKKYPKLKFKS